MNRKLGNEMADRRQLLQLNTLVRNQFFALPHQLYVMNCNTGHTKNGVNNDVRQRNTVRPNSFSDKQILA